MSCAENSPAERFSSGLKIEIAVKRDRIGSTFTPTPESRKSFKFGERGCGLKPRGEVQDFQTLRNQHLQEGVLFEDSEFPAENSSLFFSTSPSRNLEWKRPHKIVPCPKLFVKGASRFDVKQGELGDCWLLAAIANLTLNQKLFEQIVPVDQSFDADYAGIFYFRFWQYGKWIDVVIDDLLPTYNGRLVFMHSDEQNEFWSALLEKAYAKLHGSYEALKGGATCEAMEDFTGGVAESIELRSAPSDLLRIMFKANERGSFMSCSIEADPYSYEARLPNGLIRGHSYSITRIKYCDLMASRTCRSKIPLVRIRNPWGNEVEWNGAWSDQSPEWRNMPPSEKEEMGLTFEHDGEFWMSFEDFSSNFDLLELTNLPFNLSSAAHSWEMSSFESSWVKGATAGGCRNFPGTFWRNPQFKITLSEADDGDDDNRCTVVLALMQKNRRAQRKLGLECLTIGFALYKLKNPDELPHPLDSHFFRHNTSIARSPCFINRREVAGRFKLKPGTYCIVPSTFEPNQEGEFILRVFSEKKSILEENDEEVGHCEIENQSDELTETDRQLRQLFRKVAGDDGEIDWKELKDIMDFAFKEEINFHGFSKDVSRSLIAMMDVDRSGKLCLQEFLNMWKNIRLWKNVFKLFDVDGSGCLSGFELREALNGTGYRLNTHLLNTLIRRYGNNEGNVTIDDFVMCCAKLRNLIETFVSQDKLRIGKAYFSLENFIDSTIYS